jgi:8-oxo-dGTP pyrophosphatase MutT (NUDIX family)
MSNVPVLRLAATAIPVRAGTEGPEFLMVKRSEALSFGGMWTFPGGAIDAEDGVLPPSPLDEATMIWDDPDLLTTARVAAARETLEETALVVDPDALVWLSHWIPPAVGLVKKRFATWFFLAPEATGDIVVDERENSEARWLTPAVAIDEFGRDEFPLAPPTWTTLWDLNEHATVDALFASAGAGPAWFHTRIGRDEEAAHLMWEGDAGHASGDIHAPGARNRTTMDAGGLFRRER